MLQQTQVSRVIDYYHRFLERFPDVQTLAEATWKDILPYWRGLGFYSRGKNMLLTARMICDEFGGKFPGTRNDLLKLPGVGEYTASAILSFAYNKPVPALDTNIKRVLKRVFFCTDKGLPKRSESLFELANKKAPNLNHTLMDLGATLCQSRRVQCEVCPLQTECSFFQSGKKEKWEKSLLSPPRKKIVSLKPAIEVAAACIHHQRKYLIAKRTDNQGGFWEFPGGKREKGESWRHALKREIQEELGVEVSVRPHFFEDVWEDGEFLWRIRFFRCQILQGTPKCLEHEEIQWIPAHEFGKYKFPSANAKAIQKLKNMRA